MLRRPVEADASEIFRAYTQDPLFVASWCGSLILSEAETHAFITSCIAAWEEGSRLPYVITEASSPSAIGMLEARIREFTVDFGYCSGAGPLGERGLQCLKQSQRLAAAALAEDHFRVQAFL